MTRLIAMLILAANVMAQEVNFSVTDLDGKTAEHEFVFSTYLTSDRGEQLAYPGGEIDIEIQGTWRSHQTRTKSDSGGVVANAVIKDGESWAKMAGSKLTFEQYPFTIEQLNDKSYSWKLDHAKGGHEIEADFRPWRIKERTDIVNDMVMIWQPALLPPLPEGPVNVGDTWTGESTVELPFYKLGARKKKFRFDYKSTLTLKSVKEKKGSKIAQIEEKREITAYYGWIETVNFSVLLVEGTGSGIANWEIDATRGLVNKADYIMTVNRPILQRYGHSHAVPDANSNLNLLCQIKLKKLK